MPVLGRKAGRSFTLLQIVAGLYQPLMMEIGDCRAAYRPLEFDHKSKQKADGL